jgi:hypothetical protein
MDWNGFLRACPEIGRPAEERFARDELVLLGTLTRDGWPRISPCEVDIVGGHLLLGMMWRSPKALDLRRDPRITVHSVQCDRKAAEPDLKFSGRASEIEEPALRDAYRAAIKARIDWEPEEPNYHLFSFEVEWAASVAFSGDGHETVVTWDPRGGLRTRRKSG